MPGTARVEVRSAAQRCVTRSAGVQTWHSFSAGEHYDPANTSHGPLVACDEHRLAPGAGFPDHVHRGIDVVTWVLEGALRHADADGRVAEVGVGSVARLRTGTGITHSEVNASGADPLRFLQMWLLTDDPHAPPSYDVREVGDDLAAGEWVPLVTGSATLLASRPAAGRSLTVPGGALAHLMVTRGAVRLAGQELGASDTARLDHADPVAVAADAETELLLWLLPD